MASTSKTIRYLLGPVSHRARLRSAQHKDGHEPLTQSGLTPARAKSRGSPLRVHFRVCVVCANEHEVYFVNNQLRCPLEPASLCGPRASRPLFVSHFHACVVCASEHDVYSVIPSVARSAAEGEVEESSAPKPGWQLGVVIPQLPFWWVQMPT